MNRWQMRSLLYIGLFLGCIAASVSCVWLARTANEAKRRKEAITWIDEHGGTTSYPSGAEYSPIISFRGAAIDDESLAALDERLRSLGPIIELDLRGTRVTGRTLATLSCQESIRGFNLALDPGQINDGSIGQLNQCQTIAGIKLTGVTENAVMELLPVLRKWNRPGKKILVLDTVSADGFKRLETEASNLSGVHTEANDHWHPIAMRAGPR